MRELHAYRGSTPTLDGRLSPGEWDDATTLTGMGGWKHCFTPTTDPGDLSLTMYVKHDGRRLYFAFDVTDDVLYGIDIPRWLPEKNPLAHEVSQRGWPWFGDGVEVLLNPSNIIEPTHADGSGASWQMVCSTHKSRLGGVGVGGLLEGEPRSKDSAYQTYQRWIEQGHMQAAVRIKDRAAEGSGYVIEWAIDFDPCIELRPGVCYDASMPATAVGFNVAVQDLDEPAKGEGNFGHIHHEDWFTGEQGGFDRKHTWGRLWLMPGHRLSCPHV